MKLQLTPQETSVILFLCASIIVGSILYLWKTGGRIPENFRRTPPVPTTPSHR